MNDSETRPPREHATVRSMKFESWSGCRFKSSRHEDSDVEMQQKRREDQDADADAGEKEERRRKCEEVRGWNTEGNPIDARDAHEEEF